MKEIVDGLIFFLLAFTVAVEATVMQSVLKRLRLLREELESLWGALELQSEINTRTLQQIGELQGWRGAQEEVNRHVSLVFEQMAEKIGFGVPASERRQPPAN